MVPGRGRVRRIAAGLVWVGCSLGCTLDCCVEVARGQSSVDGAIGGRVTGEGGRPLAGARVVAQERETGERRETRSGSKGEFLLVRLSAGDYTVTVEQAGRLSTLPDPVAARLGEVTEIEARMVSPGSQPAAGPAPGPAVPGVPGASQTPLAGLPVDGGQWRSAALTVAGGNTAGADEEAESFRGVATGQNSSQLDGVSGDDAFSGARVGAGVAEETETGADATYDPAAGVGSGGGSVAGGGGRRAGSSYAFSQAGVREFRVRGQSDAAAYGAALYGHGVGGAMSTVSRSGGRTLHGTAFYTLRNSGWAAVNPFSVATRYVDGVVTSALVKPKDLRQQLGVSLGGPVGLFASGGGASRTDQDSTRRLFFFYAFDAERRNFPAISAPGYAAFYMLTAMQTALLANRGVTAAATHAALNYLDSLTGPVARSSNQTVNFGRLDWRPGSAAHPAAANRIAIEYNRVRWSSPGGGRTGAVVDRGLASFGSSNGAVDAGVVQWSTFWRTAWSNQLRAQFGRELLYETAQPPLAQEPNIGPGGLAPEVSIGPEGMVFGTPAALGRRAYPDERRLQLADNLGWVHGRHFVQVGADFSALSDRTDSLTNAEGTYSYDSGFTGGKAGGLVDWITDYTFNVNAYPNGGCPSIHAAVHDFCFRSYSQSFGQQSVSFPTQEWAGFVQDDWRVARRLTLHLGVRYEYELLPLPQRPNAGLDAVFGKIAATGVFPEDRNNFGPRLGLEWAPFGRGRSVLRAGYGVYFGKLAGATIRAALLNTAQASSTVRVRILPTTGTACPQRTTVGFGYPCSFLTAPTGVLAATTSAMVFDKRFRLPMVQQGTLELEQALGGGMHASARYVVNLDRQLPNSVDINIAPSTGEKLFQLQGGNGAIGVRDGETFAVPVYGARLSPSFGPVTDIVSNADASYHGVTLEARRGVGSSSYGGAGRSLDFRVAWTWSKAIDFGQNSGPSPRANGQFDPFNVRYDKGLSALNFPHRVTATMVWTPRFLRAESNVAMSAQRPIWKLANGWQVGTIFSEASGRGYSYDVFGGTRLSGGHESINGSGGSAVLPTVGRNTLRLPDSVNLDLRVNRSFHIGERVSLRAAIEGFNVINHVNYSGVTQRAFLLGTPANGVTPLVFQDARAVAAEGLNVRPFGTLTEARGNQAGERQLVMRLRLDF